MAIESPASGLDDAVDAEDGLGKLGPCMKAFKWRSAPWARGDCMHDRLFLTFS